MVDNKENPGLQEIQIVFNPKPDTLYALYLGGQDREFTEQGYVLVRLNCPVESQCVHVSNAKKDYYDGDGPCSYLGGKVITGFGANCLVVNHRPKYTCRNALESLAQHAKNMQLYFFGKKIGENGTEDEVFIFFSKNIDWVTSLKKSYPLAEVVEYVYGVEP